MIIAFKLRSLSLCKAGALATVVLTAALMAPVAHAQIIIIGSSSAGDTVIGYSNFAAGSTLPYPYTTSSGSETLTFTNNRTINNNNHFERNDQQGLGFSGSAGDFLPGTKLLVNAVHGTGPTDALTLTFSSPVSEFGFQYEPSDSYLPADYTFAVFQNGAQTFTDTETGIENGAQSDGSAPFFGVKALTNSITSVVIYGTDSQSNGVNADAFFIGPVSVGTVAAPVPEPGTIALLAGASLPIGLLALRRRRR